ncbi:Gfo/Idh/MocA family protein [Paenibacillus cymbidii]|uniref:Gfo/Idh/MocA family protein n=1 Tax=Paenibacillus cymbidii TaxID=1639034 RepID=UPI0010807E7F|nr:Gfo/Idh/MocA family oxidoreductase [Paenibacillus cymbidii]
MKIAIVGCGTMGRITSRNLAKMPGVELVAVCDVRKEMADALADAAQTRSFGDFEEMMRAVNPDIVCVTLPTWLHKEYVLKAAALGKHVICEKPLAPTVQEGEEMIRFCAMQGVRLFVGHVVRFFPNFADIERKIAAGAIGRVGVAHTKRSGSHPGRTKAKEWYKDYAKSGGVIMDLMIHDIDFVRWVLGEVKTVYAMQRLSEGLHHALVTFRFRSGAIVNLESCWGYPGPFATSCEFAGNKGIIRYDGAETQSLQLFRSAAEEQEQPVAVPQSPAFHDPYYLELRHFIDCIHSGAQAIVTAEDGLKAVELSLAAIQSAETGLPVSLGS